MSDQQLWHLGTECVEMMLENLPDGRRVMLAQLLIRYRKAKEAVAATISAVDAAADCRECAGQCCQNGKYRINVIDVMARFTEQTPKSADFTRKPGCPYGTDAGCAMEPGLRPADCVLFICDAIDRKLSPQARQLFAAQEHVLRGCIQEASNLTGELLGTPLLLWAEKI